MLGTVGNVGLTRKELLVELLRSYHDACSAGDIGEGSGSLGDRLLLMSEEWHEGSYSELHRALCVMRAERPAEYWHVAERYLRCTRRQTMGCPECRQYTREGIRHVHYVNGRGQKVERTRIIEERWNPRVSEYALSRGLDYLSTEFRGEPFLPKAIYEVVAS